MDRVIGATAAPMAPAKSAAPLNLERPAMRPSLSDSELRETSYGTTRSTVIRWPGVKSTGCCLTTWVPRLATTTARVPLPGGTKKRDRAPACSMRGSEQPTGPHTEVNSASEARLWTVTTTIVPASGAPSDAAPQPASTAAAIVSVKKGRMSVWFPGFGSPGGTRYGSNSCADRCGRGCCCAGPLRSRAGRCGHVALRSAAIVLDPGRTKKPSGTEQLLTSEEGGGLGKCAGAARALPKRAERVPQVFG